MKPKSTIFHFLTLAGSSVLAISSASAADGTWNVDADGTWSTGSNWTPGIADGSGSTANFTNDITADRTVTLDSNRTLTSIVFGDSNTATAGSWILSGSSTLTLAGTTPGITVNALGTGKAANIGTVIAGSAGLVKSGTGTLILTNANTYTGGTTISEGTLQVGNGAGTGSIGGNVSIASGANLTINRTGPVNLGSSAIIGNGSVTWQSGTNNSTFGTLSASNSFSGGFTLNGWIGSIGSGVYGGFGSGTVTIAGGALLVTSASTPTFNNTMRWNANFAVDRAGSTPTLTWGGDITLGANIAVNGSAAGGGYTHIFNGRILNDTTPGRSLTFNTVGTGGRAFITLNGKNTFTGNLTISRGSLTIGGTGNLGDGDYSGNISISSTATAPITYSSSSDQMLRGNITGVSTLALTKDTSASSVLTLAGTNTYAGGTTLNAGTLQFAKKLSQPASGAVAVRDGTTLAVNLGGTGEWSTGNTNVAGSIGGLLAGTGGQTGGTVTYTGNVALGFDTTTAGSDQTYSGVLGNVGTTLGIKKLGIGTLILDQANTYTGATAVNAGKLVVSGSIGASAVTVSGTGTILATDTAASFGSTLAINAGAILAVGDAANATTATATVTGASSFADTSIFSWDIDAAGTAYDKLVTASLVDGNDPGGAVLRIVASDDLVAANFWNTTKTWADLFTTDGSVAIANWADIFTSITVVNSSFATITPVGGSFSASGNTLTWTAIPEPSTALGGILLTAGLLRRRRKDEG